MIISVTKKRLPKEPFYLKLLFLKEQAKVDTFDNSEPERSVVSAPIIPTTVPS